MSNDNWVEENDPRKVTPEAIRFGTTENSGKAVYAWVKQHTDTVYAGVLFSEKSDRLQVRADGKDYELLVGDYLALVPITPEYLNEHVQFGGFNREGTHQFRLITEAEWIILYGEGAAQELPDEPSVAPFEDSTDDTVKDEAVG